MPSLPANAILDIPPEIIVAVFDFVDFSGCNQHSLIDVASVCKQWHAIVWSRPQFWTTLHVNAPKRAGGEGELVEYMARWFGRAGDLPLVLHLSRRPQDPVTRGSPLVDYLAKNRRWRALTFRTVQNPDSSRSMQPTAWVVSLLSQTAALSKKLGHGCWDELQSITIDSPQSVMTAPFHVTRIAPSLRIFELTLGFVVLGNSGLLEEPFVNVKTLDSLSIVGYMADINGPLAARLYYGIIAEGVHLRSLKIHDLRTIEMFLFAANPPSPVMNTSLSSLDLRDSSATRLVLENLTLPKLVNLKFGQGDKDPVQPYPTIRLGGAIRQLVERSQCRLQSLHLGALSVVGEDLVHMMDSLPTLQELHIRHVHRTFDGFDFIKEMADRQDAYEFLPALRSFSFSDVPSTVLTSSPIVHQFKRFVETPRRWCNAPVVLYILGRTREYSPEDGWSPRDDLQSFHPYHPLESARLLVGRDGICVYSRVVDK